MVKKIKCRIIEPVSPSGPGNYTGGNRGKRTRESVGFGFDKNDSGNNGDSQSVPGPRTGAGKSRDKVLLLPGRSGCKPYIMERLYPGGMVLDFVA